MKLNEKGIGKPFLGCIYPGVPKLLFLVSTVYIHELYTVHLIIIYRV